MMRRWFLPVCCMALVLTVQCSPSGGEEPGFVVRDGEKVYIVDRLGERWDVTQAEGAGFTPGKFQYGIGRNAFTTLDDSLLTHDDSGISESARVIGISEGAEAKAYSVKRLRMHEVSNSLLMGKPVAVGY